MNVVTSSHIYCLYPALTASKVTVNAWCGVPGVYVREPLPILDVRKGRVQEHGLTLYENGTRPDRPCGLECPKIMRSLKGLRDVGVFQWGGWNYMKQSTSDIVPSFTLHYNWSLGTVCRNTFCSRGVRPVV